ncbi:hypothetical protein SS50377_26803 [Spironucleus salmonicida]|uniref:Uncharacterized protein n=1 Tax=Spironucleus salmonicida TaxID=348837 RepID=V6LYF3_9EUKA|nr:hypothetical protein SS50377_26803 [Spironucleus salmonicida]|eukprot:EST49273.1 Hypothetical protein SS50377_10494 [Spironucleus salmonicida]
MPEKESFNAVFFDMTWRDRLNKEYSEVLKTRKQPDITLYHNTETQYIFGGSDLKQDYHSEMTASFGARGKMIQDRPDVKLDKNTFIPESEYHTTNGDTYGYGDKYEKTDSNIFTGTHKMCKYQ